MLEDDKHEESTRPQRVTELLEEITPGDASATEKLFPLVYNELRRLAKARMARERSSHTLTPTALVNEAYLRLVENRDLPWANRRHFFGAAAEAMRRILVDWARTRGRDKRGGGRRQITLGDDLIHQGAKPVEILDIDRALKRLEELDPDMAHMVVLRYFGGLTMDETAAALGTSKRTVSRMWRAARSWIYREITAGGSTAEE